MTYTFAQADNKMAQRNNDGAFVPWNPALNQPLDINGGAGRQWKADGSPIPDPYVAPPPTTDQVRAQQYNDDTDRQTIVTRIKDATPQQVKTWIQQNATTQAEIQAMLVRLTLLIGKTLRD